MLADEAFGAAGGRVVKTVIALSLIGWVGVILSVLGSTAGGVIHGVWGINIESQWIAIAAAVAVAAITLRGVSGLEYIGMVIGPLLCGLLAWTLHEGCPSALAVHQAVPNPGEPLGFGAAVSAVVGEYVVGIVIQPDYGRFVRRPVHAGIASGLALGAAFPAILVLSAMPPFRCSAPDLIAVMVAMGIGLPALALVVLGAWTDAAACLYSGSLSLTNEVKAFSLPWVTVCAAAAGCVFAVLHAERQFMPFLALLGITFPPVAAINILHVMFQRRSSHSPNPVNPVPGVRLAALLSWVCGSAVGYASAHDSIHVTGTASIDTILAAAVVWALCKGAAGE